MAGACGGNICVICGWSWALADCKRGSTNSKAYRKGGMRATTQVHNLRVRLRTARWYVENHDELDENFIEVTI